MLRFYSQLCVKHATPPLLRENKKRSGWVPTAMGGADAKIPVEDVSRLECLKVPFHCFNHCILFREIHRSFSMLAVVIVVVFDTCKNMYKVALLSPILVSFKAQGHAIGLVTRPRGYAPMLRTLPTLLYI